MVTNLYGQVAVVTGGASGIGFAIAQRLKHDGATVAIFDISGADEAAAALGVTGIAVDVSEADAVAQGLRSVCDQFGALHILVNNAGIDGAVSTLSEYPIEAFDAVIAVNLRGTFLCLRYAIPYMIAAGGGVIINISSAAALKGVGGLGPYSATKAAVLALTRTAALEYSPHGIRVNAVLPGAIETPLLAEVLSSTPGMREAMLEKHPIGRFGTPSELASTVAFLVSEEAAFITGASLAADGAWGVA
jgi:NAD(P)-dependent dehydrogenase (short-subunit alcohol dehydrogenase family)